MSCLCEFREKMFKNENVIKKIIKPLTCVHKRKDFYSASGFGITHCTFLLEIIEKLE